jgi:hypothetical protein
MIKIISAMLMLLICITAISCDKKNKDDQAKKLLPLLLLSDGTTKLILFNAGTHDGNLGGRSGADAPCGASANAPVGAKNIHAFISISADDELRDMGDRHGCPADFAVYGPDGTSLIANNWTDMLDNSINMSLTGAGVVPNDYWISGSDSDGAYGTSYNNCSGFTNSLHAT